MKINISPLFALLLAFAAFIMPGKSAGAQDTLRLTLSDAISIALENNYRS